MASRNKPPNFSLVAKELIGKRPRMVAVEAMKFFKECFVKGGWTDESFQEWKKRTSPLGGKKILIGGAGANTMNLMQSIRTLEESEKQVRTGTELIYGATHNEGAEITVTLKMKKYWWAKYYEFAGKLTKTKNGKVSNSARNKTTNAKAEYCKRMALMKVGTKIKIPKRQFIGESKTLLNQFEKWWADEIDKLK